MPILIKNLSLRLARGTSHSMNLYCRKAILHTRAPVDQGVNMSISMMYNPLRFPTLTNKRTETKATTAYPVQQLYSMLPKLLYPSVRKSKYYTSANDSLTFQAQDSRSRDANAQDNRRKLTEELVRIYKEAVPAETSSEKKKKHQEIGKRFHDTRIKQKKFTSAKKQSRKGE
jgi:hypothetical protein